MTRPFRDVFGETDLTLSVRVLTDTRAVVSVRGCLDAAAAPAVQARIHGLVDEGCVELVCDLTEVRFLDSAGLSALVSGLTFARERGGFLRLAGLDEEIARDFRVTKLDHVFVLYPSAEAALA